MNLQMQVSLSSEVMQMVKMVPRGFTATADAYLTPHIMRSAGHPLIKFAILLYTCYRDGCLENPEFCAQAWMGLGHVLRRYIEAFQSGFDEGLKDVQLSFMQSDGGLSPVSSFCGHKAVLSGPAGGCDTDCCSLKDVKFEVFVLPGGQCVGRYWQRVSMCTPSN